MKHFSLTILAAASLALYSCGGDMPKNADTPNFKMDEAATVLDTIINLEAGDDMKFNHTAFAVPVGKTVTLNLKHTGKMDINMMGHNVVVLKKGEDVRAYGTDASKAKAEDYAPQSLADKVIAHTKMIGPNETSTITFTLTEAGEYPFLCSFPGHYAMMKGIITAK